MIRLFVSIVLVVFGSLIAIGWSIDRFMLSQEVKHPQPETLSVHQTLLHGVADRLAKLESRQLLIETDKISTTFNLPLDIIDANDIALPHALTSQLSTQAGLTLTTDEQYYLLRTIPNHPNYLVRLFLPKPEEDNHKLNVLLTAILYSGVCIILLAWLFPLARRLYLLTQAAGKIAQGEHGVRVKLSAFSNIYALEKRFNFMAAQIEKLMADNKLLARSLSHDIRTPMSCLRFGVEAAIDTPDVKKKDEYLARMEVELTRMEDMTSAFLSYASMERQGIKLQREVVDIAGYFTMLLLDFQDLADQHNLKLNLNTNNISGNVEIDHHWFSRAIQNLLSNAVQYANTQIEISLKIHNKRLQILVQDDGNGIDEENIDKIFAPFVKLDDDKSREQGHFGLGLAICAKVVNWHSGTISAANSTSLSGACFTIELPVAGK